MKSVIQKINTTFKKIGWKKILNFPLWFWGIIIFSSGFKIWLVSGQHIFAIGHAMHDDALFVKLANNIIQTGWLGDYNNLTLAKGPFYPLWLTFAHYSNIPLLLLNQLLYLCACLALTFSVKNIFKQPIFLAILYVFLFYNPVSFANSNSTRILREEIYASLTLLVVAFFTWIFTSHFRNLKKSLILSFWAGLFLSFFWFTREEGVWILPFVIPLTLLNLIKILKQRDSFVIKKILILATPFFVFLLSYLIVSSINYRLYGIFNTVEFKDKNFVNAYSAMATVKSDRWIPDIPVTKDVWNKIYKVSPAFSELKPYLEGDSGTGWAMISTSNSGKSDNQNEIRGGWFMWAFRDAVSGAGYYSDGKTASVYYQRLAQEINNACQNGQLDCIKKRPSMSSPWNNNYFPLFFDSFKKTFFYLIDFDGVTAKVSLSIGEEEQLNLFQKITNENPQKVESAKKIKVLENIVAFYRTVFPIFISLASASLLFSLFTKKAKIFSFKNPLYFLAIFLALTVIGRMVILTLIDISSFPSINVPYLSPAYPLLIFYSYLGFFSFFILIKKSGRKLNHLQD